MSGMRIAVFGSGGIGGFFGALLARAGRDVSFIARGAHLEAMRATGLTVASYLGDFHLARVVATDDLQAIGPVDVVLVGVKAWQVQDAARAMRPLVGSATVVVPIQNGVEAPAQLAEVLGAEHVLGGLCRTISYLEGAGRIRHVGVDPYLAFGELDNRRSERIERLLEWFSGVDGLTVEVPADIAVAMWTKFALICSVSGLGAVTRVPIGVVRTVARTRRMFEQSLAEIVAVGQAHGVALPAETVTTLMGFVDRLPAEGTASMQRDLMEGRPSELEAQNGAVVRLGAAAGVATPINAFIYGSLLPMEQMARGAIPRAQPAQPA